MSEKIDISKPQNPSWWDCFATAIQTIVLIRKHGLGGAEEKIDQMIIKEKRKAFLLRGKP